MIIALQVDENRTKPARRTPRQRLQEASTSAVPGTVSGPGPALPSPKQLAWLLVRPTEALPPSNGAAVRRAEQDKEAAKKAEEAKVTARKAENCARARNYQKALDGGERMARTTASGEREVYDDKIRAEESRRTRDVIAQDCK